MFFTNGHGFFEPASRMYVMPCQPQGAGGSFEYEWLVVHNQDALISTTPPNPR